MAKGKVSREGGESFSLPADTQSNLDPDTAIVGDASDGHDIDTDLSDDEKNWDAPPAGTRTQQHRQAEDRQDDQAPQFDEEDARLAYSDDLREQQEEDQNQRPGRRSRRNARRRESQTAAQAEIERLKQQLQELGGVVRTLATGQTGLAANTLEGQITSLESALRMADEEMANAVKNSDGDTYSKAQNIRDNIVGRLWAAKNRHSQLLDSTRREPEDERRQNGGQVQDRQPPQQIDPRIVEAVEDRFDRFCERFPWFDPQSAEANCNIVRSIDQELAARGLQRHTPHFWEQMERRMAQYGLRPEQGDDGEGDGQNEPQNRQQQRNAPAIRSRPPTGSGRSTQTGRSNANNSLSEQQVALLRDEGLLEEKLSDEDVAKRDRIISRWRAGNSSLRRQGAR